MTTITTTELTEKTATNFLTGRQLSVLFPQVKKGDHRAINMVYEAFKPMIKSVLKHLDAYATLGEDAENTAWLCFWEAAMAYKDADFASLPGLLKVKIHFEIKHLITNMQRKQPLLSLDAMDASGRYLCEPAACDSRLEAIHQDDALQGYLRKLSPKQREIVLQTVMSNMSLNEYAQKAHISYTAAYKLQRRALAILKSIL